MRRPAETDSFSFKNPLQSSRGTLRVCLSKITHIIIYQAPHLRFPCNVSGEMTSAIMRTLYNLARGERVDGYERDDDAQMTSKSGCLYVIVRINLHKRSTELAKIGLRIQSVTKSLRH